MTDAVFVFIAVVWLILLVAHLVSRCGAGAQVEL